MKKNSERYTKTQKGRGCRDILRMIILILCSSCLFSILAHQLITPLDTQEKSVAEICLGEIDQREDLFAIQRQGIWVASPFLPKIAVHAWMSSTSNHKILCGAIPWLSKQPHFKMLVFDPFEIYPRETILRDRDQKSPISMAEMKHCDVDGDCVPVGCLCWCSGGNGFSYEDLINQHYVTEWYEQQECEPTYACLEEECPPVRAICSNQVCVVEKIDYSREREDKNLRLEISQNIFTLADEIEIEITILAEGVYLHGPCDWWFERETDVGWEFVGECPDTNFTDEPFPRQSGDEMLMLLPLSDTNNVYTYNYILIPGVYRFGISYGTEVGISKTYSAPFELVDD